MRESDSFRIDTRKRLYNEQNGVCVYCKKEIKGKPSLDHVIPLDLMEENEQHIENYVVCCQPCNKNKGNLIVFSNLTDKEIYPMIDVDYYFRVKQIIKNFKDKENLKWRKSI